MSSPEDTGNDGDSPSNGQEQKKRRIQRACDICRRKKIRCDGSQMPGNRCSNCSAYNLDCTYVEAAKKRGPPKGYVESLENRLVKMEKLLTTLCPDTDLTEELGGHLDLETWTNDTRRRGHVDKAQPSRRSSRAVSPTRTGLNVANALTPLSPDDLVPSDDDIGGLIPCKEPKQERFHGKSSGMKLIQDVVTLKHEYGGNVEPPKWVRHRRQEYWQSLAWETVPIRDIQYEFPPPDLLAKLIDAYFRYMNPFYPLLHRPSFERAIREGKHYIDQGFATVVILVCSVGARWLDDPRVYLDVEESKTHSAGWMYFRQTAGAVRSLIAPPRLYDLQVLTLAALYMFGCSTPQVSWTLSGMGLRLAQDVGAHRRKVYNPIPSVESELWKRAFWVLIALDRVGSAALGRPCAIQDEDFDLDLPLEVDDEYWENADPEKAFKQPEGVSSTTSYFIASLKLAQITAFALRTIYSINKSKILLGFVGTQWEQHIVAELDSALNKWLDTVPEHLHWDPHRENELHFAQSAALYAAYYHLQILIHRPFIPSPRKPSPLTFPSLAICTNAARSCSHVADLITKRQSIALPHLQVPVFTSGVVLLLNIWGARKTGVNVAPAQQMEDVQKCMAMLTYLEPRWQSAGRLWDILNELAQAGDKPLPVPVSMATNKRERGSENSMFVKGESSNRSQSPARYPGKDGINRPIAGRKSLNQGQSSSVGSSPAGSAPSPCQNNMSTPPTSASQYACPPSQFAPTMDPALSAILSQNESSSMWQKLPTEPHCFPPAQSTDPNAQNQAQAGQAFNPSNLNLFDFFHADANIVPNEIPSATAFSSSFALNNNPPPEQSYFYNIGGDPGTAYSTSQPNVPPLDSDFVPSSFTETLQMWSSVPGGFDSFENWGPYMQSMAANRFGAEQENAYTQSNNQTSNH